MNLLNAQEFECGSYASESDVENIITKLNHIHGLNRSAGQCSDPVWTNGDVTYNLILEYSPSFTPESVMSHYVNVIRNTFGPYGIRFNILLLQNSCTDCEGILDTSWGYDWQSPPFDNCLYGRIVEKGFANYGGQGDYRGHFWSTEIGQIIIHELGHALGLLHTFHGFRENDHEVVQSGQDCPCNCLDKADLICDTPSDPYKSSFEYPSVEAVAWNTPMFNNSTNTIENLDNKKDICDTDFSAINNQIYVMDNFMSYHGVVTLFTQGQIDQIRYLNQFQPWVSQSNNSGVDFVPGGDISIPTEFNQSKVITSDLHLYSDLNISNCDIFFTKDIKIVMHNGSKLILNNAKLLSNTDELCSLDPGLWDGIKVNGRAEIKLLNGSVIGETKNTCIESIGLDKRLILTIQSGSSLINYLKDVIIAKNSLIFLRTSGGSNFNGRFVVDNCQGAVYFSNTTFAPSIPSSIINCNVTIDNDCIFNTRLDIDNSKFKTLNISNSAFTALLVVENSVAPVNIKNNDFLGINSTLRINKAIDFDVVDNRFDSNVQSLRIGAMPNNSNLILNNDFKNTNTGIIINGQASGLALECNTHENTTNTDWEINYKIAASQGDDKVAAGNTFSRFNPEIKYVPNSSLDYYHRTLTTEEPIFITGAGAANFSKTALTNSTISKCDIPYPPGPVYPAHCSNGVLDANETGIDCGGSCKVCLVEVEPVIGGTVISPWPKVFCMNGRMDGDETGVDCGGVHCPPCNIGNCSDGIRNNGEDDVDCGGPCPPCAGILPHPCFDGILNGNETAIDCGGDCLPCTGDPVFPSEDPFYTDFVDILTGIYGPDKIVPGDEITIRPDIEAIEALQDNGNTPQMVNIIQSYSASDPLYVVAQLQSASPFVSVKAIHTLLGYTSHFTEGEITGILKQNPCVLQDPWISWVVYESGSLSSVNIALIKEAQENGDVCTEKYNVINIKRHYMQYMIRQKILTAMGTGYPDLQYIRTLLNKKEDPSLIYQIYESYITEGEFVLADTYINRFNAMDETDPGLRAQLSTFKALHAILMQHYYGGNRVVGMSETQFNQLSYWAEGCYGYTTLKSRYVLDDLYQRTFAEIVPCTAYTPVEFSTELRSKKLKPMQDVFTINPNPATDKIEINFESSGGIPELIYSIQITDMLGNEMYKNRFLESKVFIDISNLKQGVYTVSVIMTDQMKASTRFIKVK
ncbi:MAG: T9SS type A sorting domain-containing protein [Saprospiraceae bacterium]|nr:T9SS type A sorting domain-containing protein [Saprospiraceae bacterium]